MKRVVLCGYGRFGRVYAKRVVEHPDLELVGVVEVGRVQDEARLDGFRAFDTLREALDVLCPSLVIVATPPALHALLAIESLQRHVDVMLAKPGALSLDEAERIAAVAWRMRRRVVVDHTPMMSPAWQRLKAQPWADGIITARFVRRGMQAYQDCGALWDWASHDVALALDLDWRDRVKRVDARAWWYPDLPEPVGVFIHLTHTSGRVSRIEVDWLAADTERRVEVVEFQRMHVWDQLADRVGWTNRGYRLDDYGDIIGVWDLQPDLHPVMGDGRDNVTRALSRAISGADDTERLLEVTRVLSEAEMALYAATENGAV